MIISKELSLLLLLAKSSDELEDDEYKLVDLLEYVSKHVSFIIMC